MKPRDYERGARMSDRAERARRRKAAPLLDAAGVLPELPTIAERAERRRQADQDAPSHLEAMQRRSCWAAQAYRMRIEQLRGIGALHALDNTFRQSVSAQLGPEYAADFYCAALASLAGWSKLQAFNAIRED